MKTAIYIKDGLFQVVLTPESDLEKTALSKLHDPSQLQVYRGGFYECQGGWTRHHQAEESTIFVVRQNLNSEQSDG